MKEELRYATLILIFLAKFFNDLMTVNKGR